MVEVKVQDLDEDDKLGDLYKRITKETLERVKWISFKDAVSLRDRVNSWTYIHSSEDPLHGSYIGYVNDVEVKITSPGFWGCKMTVSREGQVLFQKGMIRGEMVEFFYSLEPKRREAERRLWDEKEAKYRKNADIVRGMIEGSSKV